MDELEYILKLPSSNGIAIDIGANIGVFVPTLASKFRHVYAFEPHPLNLITLKDVCKNLSNVTIIEKVIADWNGPVRLYENGSLGGSSINLDLLEKQWGHKSDKYIDVEGITLDDFTRGKTINFIKCDIESAENTIFRHAGETFRNNKIEMILETHATIDCDRLFSTIHDWGYQFFKLIDYPHGSEISKIEWDNYYLIKPY
jgi:FkbM family methyltransferase